MITVNQELYDRNEELNLSRIFAEATLAVLHEPLLALDKNFIIKTANTSFYETFQLTEEETLGKNVFALQDNGWDIPGLRKELGKIQKEKEKTIEMEIVFTFPLIGERTICFNLQGISRETGEQLILLAMDDITLRKNAEKVLSEKAGGILQQHQLLHNYFMEAPAFFVILKGPEHIFEFANNYDCVVNGTFLDARRDAGGSTDVLAITRTKSTATSNAYYRAYISDFMQYFLRVPANFPKVYKMGLLPAESDFGKSLHGLSFKKDKVKLRVYYTKTL